MTLHRFLTSVFVLLLTFSVHFGSVDAVNIYYAADDHVTMYINGVQQAPTVSTWIQTTGTNTLLSNGQIISFVVTDDGMKRGFAAAVKLPPSSVWDATGSSGSWRAIDSAEYNDLPGEWMTSSYSACHWPKMDVDSQTTLPNAGQSPAFPSFTGAQYVWAAGVGGGQWKANPAKTIFVRFEPCCTFGDSGGFVKTPKMGTYKHFPVRKGTKF